MSTSKTVRCAVYTRKSTEHNLDLEFNSLDAQREACEAYIKSQLHEGWKLIPDHYDDGGISGGSLDRPDLQKLLSDIRAGKVDNVVVYKVDRLTRSLTDFAKLVELFDDHGVSFVSVTQAFNTTTSMGRLTLNVLLSFAQFEREVIGERVRDKVAASKRKGLWMGGTVPLGYANQEKKLVIVPEEAETVRWIFKRYLALGAIGPLLRELDRAGVKTRPRRYASGRVVGGGRFGKGGLDHLLKNRSYVGDVVHRGQVHPADHPAILDRALFDAVQAKLAANKVERKLKTRSSPYLLQGLIFDSAGNRMSPSHSRKKGVRYRYYVSQALLQDRKAEAGAVSRVSASEAETLVWKAVAVRAADPMASPNGEVVTTHVQRVTILAKAIEVAFRPAGEAEIQTGDTPDRADTVRLPWSPKPTVAAKGPIEPTPSARPPMSPQVRDATLAAIGKARLWLKDILAGGSTDYIARREGKGERQIRLLLRLAFLPPAAVRGLIDGSAGSISVTEMARETPLIW